MACSRDRNVKVVTLPLRPPVLQPTRIIVFHVLAVGIPNASNVWR